MALIGLWKRVVPDSLDKTVYIKFAPDGSLIYQIHVDGKIQQANLTYEVVGNQIISDQPSEPRLETTEFFFEGDDVLVLIYSNSREKYLRQP